VKIRAVDFDVKLLTDRQTDGQTNRQTNKQTYKQTAGKTYDLIDVCDSRTVSPLSLSEIPNNSATKSTIHLYDFVCVSPCDNRAKIKYFVIQKSIASIRSLR